MLKEKSCGQFSTRTRLGLPEAPRKADITRFRLLTKNCWEQWTREGTHAWKTVYGATGKTTRRDDRRIVRQALVDPTVTRSTARADVGVAIVPQIIFRHLAEANPQSKYPFRALPLTSATASTVVPSQINVECHRLAKGCILVMNPGLFWGQMITVYGCGGALRAIAYDSRCTLIVIRGTLTGQRYVDGILRPLVGPFLNGLTGAIFQQDNARPHTARVAQDFLRHFQTLPWLTRSPDLSPVEQV
ncbi:transposable element Tcb1 transposase [Trichonephila clavipes]|nr:transposable element Tcb1 transposase [Trichonephila clavipes]